MAKHFDWSSLSSRCRYRRPGRYILGFCATGLSVILGVLPPALWAQQLRISNPINSDRTEEVVELPLEQIAGHLGFSAAQLQPLIATDAAAHQRIPTQLYSSRHDADPDTLLLLVSLPAKGVMNVVFNLDPTAPPQEPLVFGRAIPERKDDFAWENKVVAYRI